MLTLDQLKLMTHEQLRWWIYDDVPVGLIESAPLIWERVPDISCNVIINTDPIGEYIVTCQNKLANRPRVTHGLVIDVENWLAMRVLPPGLDVVWARLATLLECRVSRAHFKDTRTWTKLRLHALKTDYPVLYTAIAVKSLALGDSFYLIKGLEPTEIEESEW